MTLEEFTFARRFDAVSGSAIREILKLTAQPGMISFAGGNPARSALPDETVARLCAKVMAENGKGILQYGATEGYPALLECLYPYLRSTLGVEIPQSGILPVTGSTQAMDLLCKALLNPGDVVLVENPSFLGNIQCMRLYQARPVPVESDENGLIIDRLERAMQEHHPKLLYVIPTFQNPTGKALPTERRRAIAELAAKYGVIVAEDDPYRDLRYQGEPLPAIKSFDQEGWVMFLGSFSKIISPGLRVGYLAGDPRIIRKCTIGKQSSDVHTANLNQAIVAEFLRENLLPEHIHAICQSYAVQLRAMLEQLETFPAGTTYTRPQGGLFIWVELPQGLDATAMLNECVRRHVAYVPGTHFFAEGGHANTLRLNFSNSTVEQIQEGMSVLRDVIAHS